MIFYLLIIFIIIGVIKNQATNEILEQFYKNYKVAKKDNITNYLDYFKKANEVNYIAIFNDEIKRTQFYYTNNQPDNYILNFHDRKIMFFSVVIDPCRKFKQFCCQGRAECEEDNTDITSGGDLEIAWSSNVYVPQCGKEFNNDKCGTFIEIHRPGNATVITQHKITNHFTNGYSTIFISTKKLCSGRYELWFVVRMPAGNYIYQMKPFFVKYPSCTCDTIKKYGYECN